MVDEKDDGYFIKKVQIVYVRQYRHYLPLDRW